VYNRHREIEDLVPNRATYMSVDVDQNTRIDPDFCPVIPDVYHYHPMSGTYPQRYTKGTIDDLVYIGPKRAKTYGFRQRHKSPLAIPKPVKPVHHVAKTLHPYLDEIGFVSTSSLSGLCLKMTTRTAITHPLAWLGNRFGPDYIKQFFIDTIPNDVSGHTFVGCDWFSLMSDFNEALDSLIPSAFLSGESAFEGSIFIDAIKLVVQPRKVVTGFLRDVVKRHKHRLNLSELDHYYKKLFRKNSGLPYKDMVFSASNFGVPLSLLKEGINAHLLYDFGVKPAISDIKSTVLAHSTVNDRIAFLAKNRGLYVPIRVRKVTSKELFDYEAPGDTLQFKTLLREKKRVSAIFCMGRVRKDINEASRWRMYTEYFGLNKIVGTAYELIPFSFVLDWFTNTQERINDLTRVRLGEGPFVGLTSVGSSVKDILSYEIYFSPGYDSVTGMTFKEPNNPTPLLKVDVTDYTRNNFIPDTSGVVDTSTLGLFQGIKGIELIAQRGI